MSVDIITHRVMLLQRWLDRSSVANAPTPCGHAVVIGQFGCVVPVDFDAPPPIEFDVQAMPLFCSIEQCDGTGITTDHFDPDAPASQDDIGARLQHLCWKTQNGDLPALCLVGLEAEDEPIAAAVERAAFGPVAAEAPTIALALWPLAEGPRRTLRTILAAYRPALGATDPAIDDEPARQGAGVRDIWD